MLKKVSSLQVASEVRDVEIAEGGHLHVKCLEHKEVDGPTLLLVHGGGAGANHTIVERPARWLVDQEVYGRMILPDRRGNGASSPLEHGFRVVLVKDGHSSYRRDAEEVIQHWNRQLAAQGVCLMSTRKLLDGFVLD